MKGYIGHQNPKLSGFLFILFCLFQPQEIIAAVEEAMRVYGKINILVNSKSILYCSGHRATICTNRGINISQISDANQGYG